MDKKTILIIGAVAIAVFLIIRNKKKKERNDVIEPEEKQPEEKTAVEAVVDTSFMDDRVAADMEAIRAGDTDGVLYNNIALASQTRGAV